MNNKEIYTKACFYFLDKAQASDAFGQYSEHTFAVAALWCSMVAQDIDAELYMERLDSMAEFKQHIDYLKGL